MKAPAVSVCGHVGVFSTLILSGRWKEVKRCSVCPRRPSLTDCVNLQCPEDEEVWLLFPQFVLQRPGHLSSFEYLMGRLVLHKEHHLRAGRKPTIIICCLSKHQLESHTLQSVIRGTHTESQIYWKTRLLALFESSSGRPGPTVENPSGYLIHSCFPSKGCPVLESAHQADLCTFMLSSKCTNFKVLLFSYSPPFLSVGSLDFTTPGTWGSIYLLSTELQQKTVEVYSLLQSWVWMHQVL